MLMYLMYPDNFVRVLASILISLGCDYHNVVLIFLNFSLIKGSF